MTVVTFKVTDENGSELQGINITGVTDWGGEFGIGAGNQPFNLNTNSNGQASEDNNNGIWAGKGTYTASGVGYQTITGSFNVSGSTAAQTVAITMLATAGKTSIPKTKTQTTTIILVAVAAVAVVAAIGIALVKH